MSSPKFVFLLHLLLAAPLFLASTINCAKPLDNYGDGLSPPNPETCKNCSICQYPGCSHPERPPPPPSGYPAYVAPPPPAAPTVGCPPAPPAQACCDQYPHGQYSPPYQPYPFYNETNSAALSTLRNAWADVGFSLLILASAFNV